MMKRLAVAVLMASGVLACEVDEAGTDGAAGAAGEGTGGAAGSSSGGSGAATGGSGGAATGGNAGSATGGTAGGGSGGSATGGSGGSATGGSAGTSSGGSGGVGVGNDPPGTPGSVICDTFSCDLSSAICCDYHNTDPQCLPQGTNCFPAIEVFCDGPEDCSGSDVCCGTVIKTGGNENYIDFACKATCDARGERVICGESGSCPMGTCSDSTLAPGYKECM